MSKYIDDCLAAIAEARASIDELSAEWDDEVGAAVLGSGIEDLSNVALLLKRSDEEFFTALNEAVAAVPAEDLDNLLRAAYARAEENR